MVILLWLFLLFNLSVLDFYLVVVVLLIIYFNFVLVLLILDKNEGVLLKLWFEGEYVICKVLWFIILVKLYV